MNGLVHAAGAAPSSEQAKVAGVIVEWKANVAEGEVDGFAGAAVDHRVRDLCWRTNRSARRSVRPSSSVGATVTVVPATVTLRKWKTCVADVGMGALPHFDPFSLVGDQPMP